MKKTLIVLFCLIQWFCAGDSSAESVFAKVATTFPASHPTSEALRFFKKDLAEASNGQMTIQLFSNAELGSASQLLNGLQFGSIEMGVLSSEMFAASFPTLRTMIMPYVFRDPTHKFRTLDGPIGKELLRQLTQANLIGLGFLATDSRHFLVKRAALAQPADFAGRSIGLPRACPPAECHDVSLNLMQETLTVLGATPHVLETDASAEFFQQETADGIELSLSSVPQLMTATTDAMQLILDGHIDIPDIFVVSRRWFEQLSPEQQQQIFRSAAKMIQMQREVVNERQQQMTLDFENSGGMTLHFVEQEVFFQAVQPVYDKKIQEFGAEFEEILRSIREVH